MAGQFLSAYQIADMQTRTQANNAATQAQVEQMKLQQEQQQKMAETVQKRLDETVKVIASHASAAQTKGIDLMSPQFADMIEPFVAAAKETATLAQQRGIAITTTPELFEQQVLGILNSPTPQQTAKVEGETKGIIAGAETKATEQAQIDVKKANPEIGEKKAVWDARAKKQTFATDMEIANSRGNLEPVGQKDQPPSWEMRQFFSPKTGEQKRGYFDSKSRATIGPDGEALGPEWVLMSPSQMTGTPGEFGVTTASRTKLEEQGFNINEAIARNQAILKDFKANYQTWAGKTKGWAQGTMAKAGVQLTPQQEKDLGDQRAYNRKVYENLNLTIKDVTGAAMGVQEAQRIIKQVPNPDDDPISFVAAAEDNIKALEAARMRLRYFAKQGLQWDPSKGEPPMDLETFVPMANRRKDEIKAEVMEQMPEAGPEEQRAELLRRLTAEGF